MHVYIISSFVKNSLIHATFMIDDLDIIDIV